jgi:hypothetical protein
MNHRLFITFLYLISLSGCKDSKGVQSVDTIPISDKVVYLGNNYTDSLDGAIIESQESNIDFIRRTWQEYPIDWERPSRKSLCRLVLWRKRERCW